MSIDNLAYRPHGQHLIAGTWAGGGEVFCNAPATGACDWFQAGTPSLVEKALLPDDVSEVPA